MSQDSKIKILTDDETKFLVILEEGDEIGTNVTKRFWGSDASSSVLTFCAFFPDIISQRNQWWRHKMLAVFSSERRQINFFPVHCHFFFLFTK